MVRVLLLLLAVAATPTAAQTVLHVAPRATVRWADMAAHAAGRRAVAQPRAVPRMPLPVGGEIGHAWAGDAASMAGAPSAPRPAAAVLTTGFLGLGDNGLSIPPDTHGAVGPAHLMITLNTEVRVQSKNGAVLGTVALDAFWMTDDDVFDPRIVYDVDDGRWIAVADANSLSSTSKVLFAISAGSDPTGAWNLYEFVADPSGVTWADFPGVGLNDRWVAITENMYGVGAPNAFAGAKMWVIDKASALDGDGITVTEFPAGFDNAGSAFGATLQPAVTIGSEPRLYIVDTGGFNDAGVQLLRLSRLSGSGPAPSWAVMPGSSFPASGLFPVTHNFSVDQIGAAQAGTTALLDTGDTRVSGLARFRNGHVWLAHTGGFPVDAVDRTNAYWYELDPNALPNPIVQSGIIDGGAGVHHIYPSLAVNAAGDMVIGCSRADVSRYAEAGFAGRRASDPPGSTAPVEVLKEGEGPYAKMFTSTQVRWGDYSATQVDPTDDSVFWTLQEYAAEPLGPDPEQSQWGTWWGRIEIPTPTISPTRTLTSTSTASPTRTATPTATASATATGTPTPTLSRTASATRTATPTATASATVTSTPTATLTRTATPTGIASPTATVSATATGTPTPTLTRTASATRTATPTATASATASGTPTGTVTRTATRTGIASPSATASATATDTRTDTPTAPFTGTRTATPTRTAGATATPTAGLTPTHTALPTPTATPTSARCTGDCTGDGMVSVADLILGVNIVLGSQPTSACPAFVDAHGEVTVSQLVRGVGNALNGCG